MQNALKKPPMTQFAMNWGLLAGALLIAIPTVLVVKDSNAPSVVEDVVVDSAGVKGKDFAEDNMSK